MSMTRLRGDQNIEKVLVRDKDGVGVKVNGAQTSHAKGCACPLNASFSLTTIVPSSYRGRKGNEYITL